METETITRSWANTKIKSIREILASKKINKTGRLSKSIKIKISPGKNKGISFQWVYYGTYVRKHYLKKGFDILAPLKDVEGITKLLTTDLKKQIIEQFKQIKQK